jgi:1,4-alpha-glucan branching enzyme
MSDAGCFCLVLHTHLPYVLGHGEWPHGERMLYDAAAESYLPLLRVFQDLAAEGIRPRVTVSMTPVLLEQLDDARFKRWFPGYLRARAEAAEADHWEFQAQGNGHLAYLAERWAHHYRELEGYYCDQLGHDIIGAFRALQDQGALEMMTSAATHAYLPLLHEDCSIRAQVRQGVQSYLRHFGRHPRGFWLPECAYRPRTPWAPPAGIVPPDGRTWLRKGVHEFLAESGLDYFILDTHMLAGGDPLPVDIHYEHTLGKLWGSISRRDEPPRPSWEKTPLFPYFVGSRFEDYPPVACLVRNPEVSLQVWSAEWGYPGDGWYLEFHRKHLPGDHRYWRVTDEREDLATKEPYEPGMAAERVRANAGHFVSLIHHLLESQPRPYGRRPVVCAPFDAELFGHWWHEGPEWLRQVIRWLNDDPRVECSTCREYLSHSPPATAITVPEGSWGEGKGHHVWLNPETVWAWRRVYDAELDMHDLAQLLADTDDEQLRAFLAQAGRELFLLQASDWQFLITTGSASDYAAWRLNAHHSDLKRVAELARKWRRGEHLREEDWQFFGRLCDRDHLFDEIDPEWFA